ncbi:glycosyltransferase family 2 protein [Spirosoma litoris]
MNKILKGKIIIIKRYFSFIIYYLESLKNIRHILLIRKQLINSFRNYKNNEDLLGIDEKTLKSFKKGFLKYIWIEPSRTNLAINFLKNDIVPAKITFDRTKVESNDVIILCLVKDDIERIKVFVKHHKDIGVKYFAFIDNMSTDGTFEFLCDQKDVNVYKCNSPYSTLNRETWINRIIAHYGINRWYLCLDSDELFSYIGMETIKINKLIEKVKEQKISRVRSIMIDMYSANGVFKNLNTSLNIKEVYNYFDTNSYKYIKGLKYEAIVGGPRNRMFNLNNPEQQITIVKHPLFYFSNGDIHGNSHFLFPYDKNYNLPCIGIILHYKFLESDLERYVKRIAEKSYYNGSAEYANYLSVYKQDENLTFMYKGSVCFDNSFSFNNIKINGETGLFNFLMI